ncbi:MULTISPECIES: helix-turn-helix transcriptional regulator [unclassified Lentimicrobium]|uniref:ArsR/SmtB family transcription factor n=1 Tax=unclassified Lentimicrobium TaxID=2677434 RepID=UPI001553C71D|nr:MULTISPECIES: metalloregulator ArsR/SmtB family transcription factor [unclassified Lentimicrobium]NPD45988.1 helix-turn-helix transcriptional regulator [Lentimicrobium sp. S6]NPD86788.1 helix-turn-helix transcriptional regulator [Lentimicrobium sp. L6]
MNKIDFDLEHLEKAAARLKAMAHPVRIAIIEMLDENGPLCVSEVFCKLDIEQASASHHLNILKNRNILKSERTGKHIIYSLNNEIIGEMVQCLNRCH